MPHPSRKSLSAVASAGQMPSAADCRIELERVDDLPIVLEMAKRIGVADAIDRAVAKVHGNRSGLSYGHLAWGMVGAIATERDHRLRPMEAWSVEHRRTLEAAMGAAVGEKDFTDDRLADLLWELGAPEGNVRDAVEQSMGERMVRTYRLPLEVGRADTTSVSVYHERDLGEGLLRFGKSKAHRPDLRQFVEALGTLDPAGIPLTTSTLPGNQADDPVYWPVWQRMARVLGRADWLYVGDSKLHSAENLARIHRAGGFFLTPLPMKGHVPEEFASWLKAAPKRPRAIRLPDDDGERRIVGHGFEVEREVAWTDPESGEEVKVPERVFVVRRRSFQRKQVHGLRGRLAEAEAAIGSKDDQRVQDRTAFEVEVREILERHAVAPYLEVAVSWKVEREEKLVGPGRPGPGRPKRVIEHQRAAVSVRRKARAIREFEREAGWRAYGTNMPGKRLSMQDAVEKYAAQWQPERGFHRLKGGMLGVAPVFLRTDRHIRGLMVVLGIVLRMLTLMEFVARRNLAEAKGFLEGLYAGAPRQTTTRPTAELMLQAFRGVTLHTVRAAREAHRQIIGLTRAHQRILQCLELSPGIFTALETT